MHVGFGHKGNIKSAVDLVHKLQVQHINDSVCKSIVFCQ